MTETLNHKSQIQLQIQPPSPSVRRDTNHDHHSLVDPGPFTAAAKQRLLLPRRPTPSILYSFLTEHRPSGGNAKPTRCDVCGKYFESEATLRRLSIRSYAAQGTTESHVRAVGNSIPIRVDVVPFEDSIHIRVDVVHRNAASPSTLLSKSHRGRRSLSRQFTSTFTISRIDSVHPLVERHRVGARRLVQSPLQLSSSDRKKTHEVTRQSGPGIQSTPTSALQRIRAAMLGIGLPYIVLCSLDIQLPGTVCLRARRHSKLDAWRLASRMHMHMCALLHSCSKRKKNIARSNSRGRRIAEPPTLLQPPRSHVNSAGDSIYTYSTYADCAPGPHASFGYPS
ncbi:hypothetical protein B0H10DRAFT_2211532 [Mycena sp. CBHHK59/15]|nr:hypothetical protein B0H10DRAFT_2211532 [Mycena sp. CBHHK59/15]